jgi:phosphoenolpyruvate-protein phosphotransferase
MGGGSTRLVGVAAAPGIARGAWARIERRPLPRGRTVGPGDEAVDREVAALAAAAAAAESELNALADRLTEAGHADEAGIFAASAAMAADPMLIDGATGRIRDGRVGGVDAILAAGDEVAAILAAVDDELIRARAADILDVADRIARHVAGLPTDEVTLGAPAIVVAEDLPPSLTATIPKDRLLGIALAGGSPTAHAAILARAYGIPAVVGVPGILDAVTAAGHASEVALDGSTGEVLIAPTAAEVAELDRRAARLSADRDRDLAEAALPSATRDGTPVALLANIGTPDEAERAIALGARGVGLFRTEFLFLERPVAPTEDEQLAAYRRVVERFAGDPVTIRLLDVGGDKPLPYLPIPREENPFLGVRGLRLAVDRPEVFLTQLRACMRAAAAGPVKVMAPMIADHDDVGLLVELTARARADLAAAGVDHGEISLGVMLEVPSAILTADTWLGEVAFASLGTNDLTQYALAIDRGNPAVERYRDSLHPAVLRLVALSVESARRTGAELSVCGEMAGDPVAALALVGLGIRSLSMGATSLPAVRRAIRGSDLATLEAAAAAALVDDSARAVRERFAALLGSA